MTSGAGVFLATGTICGSSPGSIGIGRTWRVVVFNYMLQSLILVVFSLIHWLMR